MTVLDILRAAISNTFRSKLRTGLTVVAIFIGAFTLTLTSAIGAGVNDYIETQVSSIGGDDFMTVSVATDIAAVTDGPAPYDPDATKANGGISMLTESDLARIGDTDGIRSVEGVATLAPDYIEYSGNGNGKFEITANPISGVAQADLAAGDQLTKGEASEVLLPKSYLDNLGFEDAGAAIGETVTIGITSYDGTENVVDAVVVGVQNDSLFGAGVGMSAALSGELNELQNTGVPAGVGTGYVLAMAHVDEATTAPQFDAIKADLLDQGYRGQTVADQIGVIQAVIDGIIGVLNAFAAIALLAASFGIINTLLMSVQERTREIGLMKAMGMSSGKVFALFSFEAIVIGFLGSAIGVAIAMGLGTLISSALAATVLSSLPGLNIMLFTPASIATIIGVVMLIAFLAGTLPARRAARQNPIDALRYE